MHLSSVEPVLRLRNPEFLTPSLSGWEAGDAVVHRPHQVGHWPPPALPQAAVGLVACISQVPHATKEATLLYCAVMQLRQ